MMIPVMFEGHTEGDNVVFDLDPLAPKAARVNARKNDLEERVLLN